MLTLSSILLVSLFSELICKKKAKQVKVIIVFNGISVCRENNFDDSNKITKEIMECRFLFNLSYSFQLLLTNQVQQPGTFNGKSFLDEV